jgi:hypothetical protein
MLDDGLMTQSLEPAAILMHAAGRLRADKHPAYAEAVLEVATYLRELEATHAEMSRAVDALLDNAPDSLLGEA